MSSSIFTDGDFSPPGASDATQDFHPSPHSGGKVRREGIGGGNFAHAFVADIDDQFRLQPRRSRRIFQAAQVAGAVEQAEFVGDLANSEADSSFVSDSDGSFREAQVQRIKIGLAVAVRPPQAWMLHGELRELGGRQRD